MYNKKLQRVIQQFFTHVPKLKNGERCLITSDGPGTNSYLVAEIFYSLCKGITLHVTWIITPFRDFDKTMEDAQRSAFLSGIDVIFQTNALGIGIDAVAKSHPYTYKKSKFTNPVYYLKAAKKVRAFWFIVESLDWFISCLDVDYDELASLSNVIVKKLNKAQKIHITSANGTNLFLDVSNPNRKPNADYNGNQYKKGQGGNLPVGEVFISPTLTATNGTFVIDASFNSVFPWETVLVGKPVTLTYKKGQLKKITGGEADIIKRNIEEAEKRTKDMIKNKKLSKPLGKKYLFTTRSVGEFGIGVNKNAQIIGELLIDEKMYGSVHIAIGRSYDGDPSLIHIDCINVKPTVTLIYKNGKDETIIKNGQFMI